MKLIDKMEKTMKLMSGRLEIEEFINWIATSGSSFERWIQFEFGFYLNRLIQGENLYIYPEVGRCDLPIFNMRDNGKSEMQIELKTIANWYLKEDKFIGIKNDVEKILKNDIPSCLIIFYLYAKPKENIELTKWILEQSQSKVGIEDKMDFEKKLDGKFEKIIEQVDDCLEFGKLNNKISFSNEDFELLELGAHWIYSRK